MRIVAINTSPLLSGEMAMFARNVTIVTFVVDGSLTPVATGAVKIREVLKVKKRNFLIVVNII